MLSYNNREETVFSFHIIKEVWQSQG